MSVVLRAMESEKFTRKVLRREQPMEISTGKAEPNGGAVALAIPVGATGARLCDDLKELSVGRRKRRSCRCVSVAGRAPPFGWRRHENGNEILTTDEARTNQEVPRSARELRLHPWHRGNPYRSFDAKSPTIRSVC